MADTSLAIIAIFLVGFTLVVLGLQIARGDDDRDDEDDEEDRPTEPARPRPSEMKPGEAPSTALPVNGPAALQRALAVIRCDCGKTGEGVSPKYSEMTFAGCALTSARWSCPGCGSERTVYFEVRDPERLAG